MKTVDIITSALNEESCLPELFSRIESVFQNEPNYEYQIHVTDNGSVDTTWEIIKSEASRNSRITGYKMARTFSFDAALTNGLENSTSELAVIMASDLQDPPEVIPELLRKFEEGYDQVAVKVISRDSVPPLRRVLSKAFYFFANRMTSGMLPESVSDYRLISKDVRIAISQLKERHRFIRGLSAWVGFRTTFIEIKRPPRHGGESKWMGTSLVKVVSSASKSILAYSAQPLAWVSGFGIFLSFASIVTIFILAIFWVVRGVPFAGFGTLIGFMFLSFSLTMLCIGILAQYLGLIYEEVKARPLFIISEKTKPIKFDD